jgi:hypothetical protein
MKFGPDGKLVKGEPVVEVPAVVEETPTEEMVAADEAAAAVSESDELEETTAEDTEPTVSVEESDSDDSEVQP